MPSSSTHTTMFERKILHYFTIACCNLYHSQMQHVCEQLAQKTAQLIDLNEVELAGCMNTVDGAATGPMDVEVRQHAKYVWRRTAATASTQKHSEMIWTAGICVLNVNAELLRMDRREEAADFFALGTELHIIALQESEKER
nr:hypothetical protein CFP56_29854 [Quercus suber]